MSLSIIEKEILLKLAQKHKINIKKGWKNFSENLNSPDVVVLDIEDIESLQAVVAKIDEINESKKSADRILLRAAAGGRESEYSESFSFTPGAEADVIVRLVGNEFRSIRKTTQENVMSVGASVQIGELDQQLYENYNLSLPTSSLIPYVTVAGLAANSGHGTGKDQPGFCGLIKAMTLCMPNGVITRIDNKHKDFETIRASNMGLFGIVLNMEIECTEAKKMLCVMDVSNIPDLLKKIKLGLFLKYPYVSVMYVPTYQMDEMTSEKYNNVIIYGWMPVDKETPNQNSCPKLAHLGQEIQIQLEKGLQITDLVRDNPQLIPYFTRYLVSKAAIGTKDSISVGPWHTVHYQTAFPRDIDDADYLFEVGKNCNEITQALEKIVTTLTAYASKKEYPIMDAVYLRFISGTNGGLSTSVHKEGNYVCGLDMVSSNGIPGYSEFKNEMAEYFIYGDLHSKPHWGKYVPLDVDYRKIYGKSFDDFIDTLSNWYKTNEMKIESSMLLNSYICNVLQLPYHPSLNPNRYQVFDRNVYLTSSRKIALNVSKCIDDNQPGSENLRNCLLKISDETLTDSTSIIFEPKKSGKTKKSKQEDDVVVKRKGCCVLF